MNVVHLATLPLLAICTGACLNESQDEAPKKPEIVEVFACSDNCPGPREQYMKRVYAGVTDEAECRKLGGRPLTIIGWGERTICEVP